MRSLIDKQNQQEALQVLTEQDEAIPVPSLERASRNAQLLKLQRTHGNQFVQRLLNRHHSSASDILQPQSDAPSSSPTDAPPQVYQALRSPGLPLDPSSKERFEAAFAQDFSEVRVHTDAEAAQSAAEINALAYTVGSDVVFGAGQYAPQTSEGQQLLAHELTHVVQQGEGGGGGGGISEKLIIGEADDEYEREADHVAEQVMRQASQDAFASPSVSAAEHPSVALKKARGANRIARQTPDAGVGSSSPPAPPPPTVTHAETAAPAAPTTATNAASPTAPAQTMAGTTPAATDAKAAEAKPAETKAAEPTTIKGALASIQVEQRTEEDWRLQPELMFKLLPDNTQAKKEAFNKALKAVIKLRAASSQVASLTKDPKKAKELAKATQDFTDAQGELDTAITGVKKLLQSHLEGKDSQLKKLRKDASTAQANLNAVKKLGAKADAKKLKEAEDALKVAQDAVDAREQEFADQVEAGGEYEAAQVKRTYYTITIDGEKIDLKDHIEAYATIYDNGLDASARSEKKGAVADTLKNSGLSASRIKILKVISGLEGGFSATQSWDRAVITWGFAQWTGGDQSDLTAALTVIKKVAPEAFKRRFQKYGIDVEKNQLVISEEEDAPAPAAGEKADQKKAPPKLKKTKGDAAAKAIRDSPTLTAVMARAGQDADIQLAEVKAANDIEINHPLDATVEVTLTIKPPEEKPKATEAKPDEKKTEPPSATPPATPPVKATDKPAEKAADKDKAKDKKPEKKPEKKKVKVRVGDVITSELGVALLANRSVHSGYPSTIGIVKSVLNSYAEKHELQPDKFADAKSIKEWSDDAEELIRPAITEDTSRAKAFVDAGCGDAQGSFVP